MRPQRKRRAAAPAPALVLGSKAPSGHSLVLTSGACRCSYQRCLPAPSPPLMRPIHRRGRTRHHGPVPIPIRPVPPLRRVVNKPGRPQRSRKNHAMTPGIPSNRQMTGVARSTRLLRAGIDASTQIQLTPVLSAQRQIHCRTRAVRGNLRRAHIPAGQHAQPPLTATGVNGAKRTQVVIEILPLQRRRLVPLDDQQPHSRWQRIRHLQQSVQYPRADMRERASIICYI
jgi:hypothetical protein